MAFPQSDMIWEDYTKDSVISSTKTVILWVFLLLLSVVLITPVLLNEYGIMIYDKLEPKLEFFSALDLRQYLSTLATLLVSVILIPFFIDMMVLMEDFRTKS